MTVKTTIAVTIRLSQLILAATTLALSIYIAVEVQLNFAPISLAIATSVITIVYGICLSAPKLLKGALSQAVLFGDFVMLGLWAGTTGYNGSVFLPARCLGRYSDYYSPAYWYDYSDTFSFTWCTVGKGLFGVELVALILFTTSFLLHIFYAVVPYSEKHSWDKYRGIHGLLSAGAIFHLETDDVNGVNDDTQADVNDDTHADVNDVTHAVVNDGGIKDGNKLPEEVIVIDSTALNATDSSVSGVKQVSV